MGITAEEALGASMTYTNKKVAESAALHREIVNSLPATGDDTTIYMILDSSATGSDIYDEWLWINGRYEHIGSTRVDLSDYYNKTQIDTALSGKANTSDIPTSLSGLSDDATHRLVTDTEKTTWNGKANSATSLAGYGITDAYTKTEVDNAVSQLNDDLDTLIVTQNFSLNNSTPIASGVYQYFAVPISKPGYTPVGIVGVGGLGTGKLSLMEFSLSGSNALVYYMNNTGSSLTPSRIDVKILFVKS